jgi:hypothetical protein
MSWLIAAGCVRERSTPPGRIDDAVDRAVGPVEQAVGGIERREGPRWSGRDATVLADANATTNELTSIAVTLLVIGAISVLLSFALLNGPHRPLTLLAHQPSELMPS